MVQFGVRLLSLGSSSVRALVDSLADDCEQMGVGLADFQHCIPFVSS
jgi:hypothetical protein